MKRHQLYSKKKGIKHTSADFCAFMEARVLLQCALLACNFLKMLDSTKGAFCPLFFIAFSRLGILTKMPLSNLPLFEEYYMGAFRQMQRNHNQYLE